MRSRSLVAAAALVVACGWSGGAAAVTIHALTADGRVLWFDSEKRAVSARTSVSGIEGKLIGFDFRPADGKLYAVSDAGAIYTIDPATGKAAKVSQLDKKFEHGGKALIDFNPQADRLRLIGVNGTSLRVDVDKGAVTVDGSLKYDAKDASNAGKTAAVTMGAYTNSMPKAKGTELFTFDTTLGMLNLQSPPNDGVQQARGKVSFGKGASVDIFLDAKDDNIAYVLDGKTLYTVGLKDGAANKLGDIADLPEVIDIAVEPLKR